MELIERYIYAVTRHLPEKQREDIAKELRGLIEDMLAERAGEREAADEDIEAVLGELGKPSKLAAKYSGKPRYLVGPEFYDTYIALLKLVLPITAFAMIIASIVGFFDTPVQDWHSIGPALGRMLGSVVEAMIQAFAWWTAIIALIERFGPERIAEKWRKDDWKPADLPDIPVRGSTIKRSDPIASIVFIVIFFIIFNIIAAGWLGLYFIGNRSVALQIFNFSVLRGYLPLIEICFGIGIVKEAVKLVIARYDLKFALINTALSLIGTVLALIAFSNFNIWNMDLVRQAADAGVLTLPANYDPAMPMTIVAKVTLCIIAFAFLSETAHTLSRAFRRGLQEEKK